MPKGLEFPRVYLVGLEEGLLPHRRSLEDPDSPSLPEERRLAYVGVTRAMNDLTITWAETRMKWGKRQPTLVSRFVGEMRADDAEEDDQDGGDTGNADEGESGDTDREASSMTGSPVDIHPQSDLVLGIETSGLAGGIALPW